MNIEFYCLTMLNEVGFVTLPGLGQFRLLYLSAYIDKESKKIFAPAYKVSFIQNYVDNDQNLAKYISEKNKISLEEATNQLEKIIFSIKKSLIDKKEVILENLGLLTMNHEKIFFRENKKKIFSGKTWKLPSSVPFL